MGEATSRCGILPVGCEFLCWSRATLNIHMHYCCFSHHSFFFSTWGVTLNKELCVSMPLVILQLILWEVELMVDLVGS